MKKQRKRKAVRQEAPSPAKATRRVSDSRLMAMLDDHMQDSMSDIAALYQKVMSRLGAKTARFEPRIVSSSRGGMDNAEHAVEILGKITNWRKQCATWKMDSRVVMLIVMDGVSISGVKNKLRMKGSCVKAHLRACLAVWSYFSKRCNASVVHSLRHEIFACCRVSKQASEANAL